MISLVETLENDGIVEIDKQYPFRPGRNDSILKDAATQRVVFFGRCIDTQGIKALGSRNTEANIFITDRAELIRGKPVNEETRALSQLTSQPCLMYEAPTQLVDKRLKAVYGPESPFWVGNKLVPCRLIHQPMECNDSHGDSADRNGFPSQRTLRRYRRLAEARAGITWVEATSIGVAPYRVYSRARKDQLTADEPHREGINTLTDEYKSVNRDSLLIYQLNHSGQISLPADAGVTPPSEVVRVYEPKGFDARPGRMLTKEDIWGIRDGFINGAVIVEQSGADGVEIKGCHAYLLSQFLRPANTRPDEYGGPLENRMRLFREIMEGIKERIDNPDFSLWVRFSMYEGDVTVSGHTVLGGIGAKGPDSNVFDEQEPMEMLRCFREWGADGFNMTAGMPAYNGDLWVRPPNPPEDFDVDDPLTYRKYHHFEYGHLANRRNGGVFSDVPVIASGFSVFGEQIAQVLFNVVLYDIADAGGIGRQILPDPDRERVLNGTANYCKRKDKCCSELLVGQGEVGCAVYDEEYKAMLREQRKHFTAPWRK